MYAGADVVKLRRQTHDSFINWGYIPAVITENK